MKALAKLKAQPGLWLTDVPCPEIKDTEVLIKVRKTSLCGTDLHIYNWDDWAKATIPVPMHVGHEFMGEIVECGAAVKGFKVGDRVSAEGHITCGHCRNCRGGRRHLCRNTEGIGVHIPGAFAEYIAMPAFNVFPLTDQITDDQAAIFDPFGNAVHTALSFDLVGEDVLIMGAGPIGVMAAAVCRHVGARHIVITDIDDYRLQLAQQFGVTRAVNLADCADSDAIAAKLQTVMADIGMREGFDVGLEISGFAAAINGMLTVMNTGGKVSLLGLSGQSEVAINWDQLVFRGLLLKGIYGREMFETWYKMANLIAGGLKIDSIITHQFAASEFEQAFAVMRSKACGKIILNWDCFD